MARKSLWLKKLFHFISAEEFVQKSTQRKIICALGEKDASLVCTKRKSSLALLIVIKKVGKNDTNVFNRAWRGMKVVVQVCTY